MGGGGGVWGGWGGGQGHTLRAATTAKANACLAPMGSRFTIPPVILASLAITSCNEHMCCKPATFDGKTGTAKSFADVI